MADLTPLNPLTKKQSQDTVVEPKLMEDSPLKLNINKLNKEKEKKDAAEEAVKVRCKTCFKEIYPQRKCFGHGGGGGGDNDDELQDGESQGYEPEPFENTSSADQIISEELLIDEGIELLGGAGQQTEEEPQFDLERIMELVVFNNDSGKGILTIRAKPGHLVDDEKEIEEFLKAIEAVFEQFKSDLKKQGIAVDDFTCIHNKNELIIRIPVPKYFDAFIQDLTAKKLLPSENTKQNDQTPNVSSGLNPFAITPCPAMSKKEDLEEAQRSGLSPFSMELKPKFTIDS
ncbi:hypothetical protein [Legionella maioricensis]|uniref:Uncharacterized protein n=1 Tax=Legionella maioricensis TaxID=2896528 RepID=A0A9X2D2J9_9GAMM|nr:hypothetical protein [Legionella maioricensis]MCL9685301.1 hypothetical protein [Legionella maioricensis]MCL9688556.1 hypothetical protein [Legionella maioricensis]